MVRGFFRIVLIAVILGLSVFYGCNILEQPGKDHEKLGIELFEKGDFVKAEFEFNKALKEDNSLAKTYYYLALLNEKNRKYSAMSKNLIRAVELAPENIDARIKLGRAWLFFNELDHALTEADEILKYSKDNIDGLTLKAAVLIKLNKQGDALVIIEDILQKQPQHIESISLKALILMQNEEFDTALTLLNPVVVSGVDDIALHLLKIQLDTKQKNIDAVIIAYERLCQLHPQIREFKYALAKIYSQANRPIDAENLLRSEVVSAPLETQPKLVLLDFLNSISKERAIELVHEFSINNQDEPEMLLQISQWLLDKQYFSEAKTLLNGIDSLTSKPEIKRQVTLFLAKIAFHNKVLGKSTLLVDELIAIDSENNEAKILKSKIHIALDQYEEAESLLLKVLRAVPNSDESLVLLAQIELVKGFPKKADNKYREALSVNPANMKALIFVVNRALKNNNIDFASELISNALKLNPNNLILLKELVDIKILSRDWDDAKEIIKAVEKHSNGQLLAKFLHGKILQEQGKCPDAIPLFKEILAISANYPDVLRQMATCYEVMNQRQLMIRFMTTFMKNNQDNVSAYLIMAQLFLLNNELEKAKSTYNKVLDINKSLPQAYAALAKLYTIQKDYQRVVETYQRGLEENPNDLRLSIYLASVFEEIEEYLKAVEIYESLLALNPRQEIVLNNYSALLVDFFGDKASLEKARKLVVMFEYSDNPFFLDSYAWIELKSGNIKEAVTLLEKVNIMAEVPVFRFHLGVAYKELGNINAAITQLQKAVDLGKQKGDFDEIETAQQLLDKLSVAE